MTEALLDEAELWIGEMRGVVAGAERVLLVRLDSGVRAFVDRCPHQGYPLSEGELANGVIKCHLHQHTFDAASGAGINPLRPCLKVLPLRVEGGRVWLVPPEPSKAGT